MSIPTVVVMALAVDPWNEHVGILLYLPLAQHEEMVVPVE